MVVRGVVIASILILVPALSVPSGFNEVLLSTTLARPVALAFTPDGRLLIAEQYSGNIRIYANGSLSATSYATVAPVYTGDNESGLLGLCIDPNFASNGYVYVFVTRSNTVQEIVRYTTTGNSGGSPTVMVTNLPTNGINHNGGGIGFGPDGCLYAVVGENGSAAADAQNAASLRGKVLRYDVSTVPASIPASNPTAGSAVYSLGHRHPFRLTWRSTGALYVSENGPGSDDEINVIAPGANYGWPTVSGIAGNASYVDPIREFTPTIAITDILFYSGSTLGYTGDLFYVDYKGDRIRRFQMSGTGEQIAAGPFDFVTGMDQPVDVEQGPDGALYYCTLPGRLYLAQAAGVPTPPSVPGGGSDDGSSGCGLIGIEPLLLLPFVARARRIRRRR